MKNVHLNFQKFKVKFSQFFQPAVQKPDIKFTLHVMSVTCVFVQVLKISLIGHRKRILASLGDRLHEDTPQKPPRAISLRVRESLLNGNCYEFIRQREPPHPPKSLREAQNGHPTALPPHQLVLEPNHKELASPSLTRSSL